ncbi:MAG: PAS domain-containing sensor histidine kinase [Fusobacterium sp.]|nr:PAS domain-containing sensor histidine kinase [Fusobacterium sp.]
MLICFYLTRKTNTRWAKINDYLGIVTNTIDSVRYGNLTTKIEPLRHSNNPSYQNVTESINRMVETLNDREKMIVEYQTELMRQNTLLETVINSLSDGILIVNEKNSILKTTPKIDGWFGQKHHDLVGKSVFDFLEIEEGKDLHKAENISAFIKHNPNKNYQLSSIQLSVDEKKRYVLLITDITNEKQLENLKEDFIATLTHDLKVPIVAESNMLNFFLEGKFGDINEKQKFALEGMKKSNRELVDLVQIILDTYKVKETGIKLYKENIMLNEFLNDIISEMQPIAADSKIKINFNSNHNIRIYADRLQLGRVVKNLISNAIIHSTSSETIDLATGEIPGFVTISVIDYGQGISKEEIPLIFNKYYSSTKKFRKIGTGLGLYLSQEIINSHKGEINVSSTENVRTEFCIKLPV